LDSLITSLSSVGMVVVVVVVVVVIIQRRGRVLLRRRRMVLMLLLQLPPLQMVWFLILPLGILHPPFDYDDDDD
jgi:hypothetical protein